MTMRLPRLSLDPLIKEANRRMRRRRLLLAWAVIALAAALALALQSRVAGTSGSAPHHRNETNVPRHPGAFSQPGTSIPLDHALRLGSSAFGVPIKLPDTSVLKPSDANQTAIVEWLSPAGETVSEVEVEFPTGAVSYRLTDSSENPNAVDEYKAEIANAPTNPADGPPPRYQIVYLSDGTPALIRLMQRGNTIEFRAGPLSIIIWAPSQPDGAATPIDAIALQALAQSIESQTPTSR